MNNEIAPVLDMLEELKQECKVISKAQAELRTTITEQLSIPKGDSIKTQGAVQIHLSKETQAKIKEHQLFVLEALSQSSKKLDSKFETLHELISKRQKPVEFKNYSLFASVQLAERMLLLLVCGLVMVSCWFFGMGANKLQTVSDYDLRYRYLHMQGKATASDFTHLDSIFITHRNPKAIRQMQQKVIDYEQALQRQAELVLQQDKIKQEQRELKKHLKK
ncbi:hypothetical protein PGIN_7BTORR_01526 [Porphyromonas gingivalis]|uniref:Uncharacterized protein n=1 Tax=Porphyromonas gingivalis F0570 TaxID=1227271 RepID=A0A0E2LSX3_PORGN|nr:MULTISPECIES: hypothetical protein [Bacteroidales]ERJ68631.1 hypothetical protein HMPREF1555_00321 [Porphyromonas gingivalis F0570]MCE8165686.1 hypothetical protein [Porphyromonas gingivalis]MCE8181314.1 hypothetical protein [Porphyromonas gingivalis]MCG2653276.1 hypothetical protein [Alloprevotella tannerae]SJL25741.1 hypothetical protein PGIN_7BTORR_01526 [Porphyromonas gingivalis]